MEDFNTLTDSEAGLGSRALDGLLLLSELLLVSGRDALEIGCFAAGIIGGSKLGIGGKLIGKADSETLRSLSRSALN